MFYLDDLPPNVPLKMLQPVTKVVHGSSLNFVQMKVHGTLGRDDLDNEVLEEKSEKDNEEVGATTAAL